MKRYLYDTWHGSAVVAAGALFVAYAAAFVEVTFQYLLPNWFLGVLLALLYGFVILALNCLVAAGVSLFGRNFKRAAAQVGAFLGVAALYAAASAGLEFYELCSANEDHFADNLSIPADVACAEPELSRDGFGRPHVSCANPDFALATIYEGGIYEYKATVSTEEDGEVYLKAYEVTGNYPLSVGRLKAQTLEKVEKGTRTVGTEFTIYEGDWGKYYAARLELWFVPANGGPERKLKEKVFKVDGWMR